MVLGASVGCHRDCSSKRKASARLRDQGATLGLQSGGMIMTTAWQGPLSPVLRSGPMDVWLGPGKAVSVAFQQTEVPTPTPNENCLLCSLGLSMAQNRDPCVSEWPRAKEGTGCSVDMMSPLCARAANKEKPQDACTSWELQEVNVFCGLAGLCRETAILCSQAVHRKGEGTPLRSFIHSSDKVSSFGAWELRELRG